MDPCAALVEASKPTDGRCSEAPSQQMVGAAKLYGNLTFTPLMTGDTVTKITLPDADGNTATDMVVPLWPETVISCEAAWKSHDLLSGPWLLVDDEQHWFVELCNRAALSRLERSGFATYIKNCWLSSMVVEKRIASHGTGTADSDIDRYSNGTRAPSAPEMITIAVDGFRVTYLKFRYQLAFRLDTDVLRFIPGYLYLQAMKFRASPRKACKRGWQKIKWNKHEARWDVFLMTGEQLSGPCVDGLSVDKSLPYEEFQAQKLSSYRRAADLWNEQDATKRKRIKTNR